jgi:hypothetical protein
MNGLGEQVEIEEDYVFPLLKSSDLGNGRIVIRKAVLVTQRHTGDDTLEIKHKAPKDLGLLDAARIRPGRPQEFDLCEPPALLRLRYRRLFLRAVEGRDLGSVQAGFVRRRSALRGPAGHGG